MFQENNVILKFMEFSWIINVVVFVLVALCQFFIEKYPKVFHRDIVCHECRPREVQVASILRHYLSTNTWWLPYFQNDPVPIGDLFHGQVCGACPSLHCPALLPRAHHHPCTSNSFSRNWMDRRGPLLCPSHRNSCVWTLVCVLYFHILYRCFHDPLTLQWTGAVKHVPIRRTLPVPLFSYILSTNPTLFWIFCNPVS